MSRITLHEHGYGRMKRRFSASGALTLPLALFVTLLYPHISGMEHSTARADQPGLNTKDDQKVWLIIKEEGRRIELAGDYGISLRGGGKLNFDDGGRVIELSEGMTILVDDKPVSSDREVHEKETVRIVDSCGKTLWKVAPVLARKRHVV